ncbi:hypothetical protein [Lysobacter sp. A3-1-A15]|uniref:hypothetical protein n=1 Tax=Novilysobacter viscosus TaxID=3098602 RepID=UPI002EDA24DC
MFSFLYVAAFLGCCWIFVAVATQAAGSEEARGLPLTALFVLLLADSFARHLFARRRAWIISAKAAVLATTLCAFLSVIAILAATESLFDFDFIRRSGASLIAAWCFIFKAAAELLTSRLTGIETDNGLG